MIARVLPNRSGSRRRSAFVVLLALLTVLQAASSLAQKTVDVQGRHVDFHLLGNIVLSLDQVQCTMVAAPGKTISLDDRASFIVVVHGAISRLSAANLTALLNEYLLPRADSAVKHVAISFEGQTVVIKGEVRKLLPVPFEARATLSPTKNGDLRVHVVEFRAAGVLTKGFLDLLGIKLDQVVKPRHQPSFRIEGDDLIVPVRALFPPPQVSARLTSVRIEGDSLLEVLGHPQPGVALPQAAQNYLYFHGGRMHFGKLTMDDVDLEIIDMHPADSFDFSLDHYLQQIAAGHARMRPDLGLTAYAEDYRALERKP